jgi:hypothetical protein
MSYLDLIGGVLGLAAIAVVAGAFIFIAWDAMR